MNPSGSKPQNPGKIPILFWDEEPSWVIPIRHVSGWEAAVGRRLKPLVHLPPRRPFVALNRPPSP